MCPPSMARSPRPARTCLKVSPVAASCTLSNLQGAGVRLMYELMSASTSPASKGTGAGRVSMDEDGAALPTCCAASLLPSGTEHGPAAGAVVARYAAGRPKPSQVIR